MIPIEFINAIKAPLKRNYLYLNANAVIVFTCGGADREVKSGRQKIMAYALKQFPDFLFFRAEEVFLDLSSKKGKDLLTLEVELLEYADCVMIIVESPGAIAELGAFSVNDLVAKSILAIGDKEHEKAQSFIRMGPLAKIASVSEFRPPIYQDFKRILDAAGEIEKRLKRIERKNRKVVDYEKMVRKEELEPKIRLFLLLDIIAIFSPVQKSEVTRIWKDIIEDTKWIEQDMAVLAALKLISVENDYLFRMPRKPPYFFSFLNTHLDTVRSRLLLHYFRKDRHRIDLMTRVMLPHR